MAPPRKRGLRQQWNATTSSNKAVAILAVFTTTCLYLLVVNSNTTSPYTYLLETTENDVNQGATKLITASSESHHNDKEKLVALVDNTNGEQLLVREGNSRSLGASALRNDNIDDIRQQQQQQQHNRHQEKEGLSSASNSLPTEGLYPPPSSISLPPVECTIQEYSQHNMTEAGGAGSQQPTVLRKMWTAPDDSWNEEKSFLQKYGVVPFYIKDRFVQVHGENCVAQFQDLWSYIRSSTSNDTSPVLQKHRRSLLAFTNDLENPALFGEDGQKLGYQVLDEIKHVNSFAILSVMTKGQSHEFHKHGESWIAQAAGTKVWYFLPPHAERPTKVNACLYLDGTVMPPPGTTTCVQSPGDVIWFPKDWYHATCSLTEWNIALGAQQGVRLRQEFDTLPNAVDNSNRLQVQELLQVCSRESEAS